MAWYYVYLIECADSTYYTGCTTNLKDRQNRHKRGEIKYTSTRFPVKIISFTSFRDKYVANKYEKYLKTGSGRPPLPIAIGKGRGE